METDICCDILPALIPTMVWVNGSLSCFSRDLNWRDVLFLLCNSLCNYSRWSKIDLILLELKQEAVLGLVSW